MPSARATDDRDAPRGQHAAARRDARCRRWAGVRSVAPQARGPQSDRLVQGSRHDGRGDAGQAQSARARWRARRPATRRRRWRRTPRTRSSRRSCSCRAGQVALGKLAQSLAYGARTLLVRGDFDDCLALAREASAELGVQLLNSINPVAHRRTEDDRVRAARAARTGTRPTGSRCRPATSATPPRSARRCARRSRSG